MDRLEALVICPILLGFGISILGFLGLGLFAALGIISEKIVVFSLIPTLLGCVISLSVCGYGLIAFAINEFRESKEEE